MRFLFACRLTSLFRPGLITLIVCALSVNLAMAQSPTVHASNVQFNVVHCNEASLSWTKGNGDYRIVVCRKNMPVTSLPSNGVYYVAHDSVLSGSLMGPDHHVIYNDSGSSVTVRGLEQGSRYYFSVFEYNISGTIYYLTSSGYPVEDTVTETISADFEIDDAFQCIKGNHFTFTNKASNSENNPMTYVWRFGDGDTSVDTNPDHTYTKGGILEVRLTATSTGCVTTSAKEDTVVHHFITDFELDPGFEGNDSIQCLDGNEFHFRSTSYPPPIPYGAVYDRTNYMYLFPNGQRRENTVSKFTMPDTGLFQVVHITRRKVDMDTIGCADTSIKFFRVVDAGISDEDIETGPLTRCVGGDSVFNFRQNGDSSLYTVWYFDNGDSSVSGQVSRVFTVPGIYPFAVHSRSVNGCTFSYRDSVVIVTAPVFSLGSDIGILLNATLRLTTREGDFRYLWSTGDTTANVLLSGYSLGLGEHEIWATVYHDTSCQYTDTIKVTVFKTGSVTFQSANGLQVSPNPTTGTVEIHTSDQHAATVMVLYDVFGRKTGEWTGGTIPGRIGIEGPPGIYILHIHMDNGLDAVVRIIKSGR